MSISFIVFIIYPNAQFPRPIVAGKDIFSFLVNVIYTHDGTNNVFPSIHVCNAIGVHLVLINSKDFKSRFVLKYLSLFGMLAICLSTVFIKQHSIIDVAGGIVLAFLIYLSIYILPKILFEKREAISD
jgi:membrane-associated phospholipid phosphatase